jgi:large subunit ribosomal protein L10
MKSAISRTQFEPPYLHHQSSQSAHIIMPPRLRLKSLQQLAELQLQRNAFICLRCQHMATAVATTPAPTPAQMASSPQMNRYSPVQPPSHRNPSYRKSQLLRSYVSLLQTTPLILVFQHNNLKATEWVGVRRELNTALRKADEQLIAAGKEAIAPNVKLTIIQTNIFEPALRIAEYYRPGSAAGQLLSSPEERLSSEGGIESEMMDPTLTHALSENAYRATRATPAHPLSTLLSGPVALLTFPDVSPLHVRAALGILSPDKKDFKAPRKAVVPGLYETSVQEGLKKLMLLGARVDGRVFDLEGVKWVGGIEGGIDGLRAQLVGMLQGFGAGLTQTLGAAASSLWATVEARRRDLEEGPTEGKLEGGVEGVEKEKEK